MAKVYDFSRICVLLVEDNALTSRLLVGMLAALRVGKILTAADGAEAKVAIELNAGTQSAFGASGIDIVLSDWLMEPVDGAELLTWVRQHPKEHIHFMPFIMLTAYPEIDRVRAARDMGVTEFLRKPVSLDGLIGRFTEVIERPRPFVRTEGFFGPNRRRQVLPFDGPDRRQAPADDTTGGAG